MLTELFMNGICFLKIRICLFYFVELKTLFRMYVKAEN